MPLSCNFFYNMVLLYNETMTLSVMYDTLPSIPQWLFDCKYEVCEWSPIQSLKPNSYIVSYKYIVLPFYSNHDPNSPRQLLIVFDAYNPNLKCN